MTELFESETGHCTLKSPLMKSVAVVAILAAKRCQSRPDASLITIGCLTKLISEEDLTISGTVTQLETKPRSHL